MYLARAKKFCNFPWSKNLPKPLIYKKRCNLVYLMKILMIFSKKFKFAQSSANGAQSSSNDSNCLQIVAS